MADREGDRLEALRERWERIRDQVDPEVRERLDMEFAERGVKVGARDVGAMLTEGMTPLLSAASRVVPGLDPEDVEAGREMARGLYSPAFRADEERGRRHPMQLLRPVVGGVPATVASGGLAGMLGRIPGVGRAGKLAGGAVADAVLPLLSSRDAQRGAGVAASAAGLGTLARLGGVKYKVPGWKTAPAKAALPEDRKRRRRP